MTKIYKSLSLYLFLLALISCNEDDPFPVPIVDFTTDPEVVEVGIEVMLDNLTTNADNYEWDFGNGQISTEISPTVTFLSPGNVTVTLRAFTVDNQVDSLSKTFRVYERVLTGYILNVFPSFNESEAWDPNEAGDEQWPDLAVIFTPTDANQSNPENGFVDGQFVNVPSSVRPIFRAAEDVTPFANPITLTDENWTFLLLDVDDDGQQLMAGAEFNPVLHSTQKNPDGMGGEIQVVTQDGTLDADIFFELQ